MRAPAPMESRYGRLTVLGPAGRHSHGEIYYLCRCACGDTRRVRGGYLRDGRTTSCVACTRLGLRGLPASNVAQLAGEYGRLTVLERAGRSREGEALYRCRCSCGTVLRIRSRSLRLGKARSCGCLRAERVSWSRKARAFRRRAALWFRGKEGEKDR